VIDSALAQMEAWQAQGMTLSVSVNLPARHLQESDFPAFIEGMLARYPTLASSLLELEVLESTALEDISGVSARMQQCRDLGVRFALDDFGTGYASLAYLRRLPIEMLKIDQSFVRDMLLNTDDLAIVEGVIGLAAAFHRQVIAEGVETTDHAVMLLHLGCDLAQGYGIARPMPPEVLPGWVASWQPDPALAAATHQPLARQDLTLALAEVEHRRWINVLVRCVDSATSFTPTEVPLDTTVCQFGKWLHGDGRREYGELAEYRPIDDLHESVHALGRQVAERCVLQDHDQARELLAPLVAASNLLISQLHALIAVVSSQARRVI
jgi:EAL domain-containing protein (putative c-di-GMP-specific phosphodiesterase class I)